MDSVLQWFQRPTPTIPTLSNPQIIAPSCPQVSFSPVLTRQWSMAASQGSGPSVHPPMVSGSPSDVLSPLASAGEGFSMVAAPAGIQSIGSSPKKATRDAARAVDERRRFRQQVRLVALPPVCRDLPCMHDHLPLRVSPPPPPHPSILTSAAEDFVANCWCTATFHQRSCCISATRK
jgi:hypothetical protein